MPINDNAASRKVLRALVMCDLVNSTSLVERLGDQAAARLARQHDHVAREAMHCHAGEEVDRTDGFLVLFEAPAAAVLFALDYQRELSRLSCDTGQDLAARVGVHFGEIVVWNNSQEEVLRGARASEIDGLSIAVVSRLVGLALPKQILVTDVAHHIARRAERDSRADPPPTWQSHGRYALKGIPEPVGLYEVGEPGIAPFRPPPTSSKARPERWWQRRLPLAAIVIALTVTAGLSLLSMHSEPALAFGERDWVVLSDVANVNADPSLTPPLAIAFRTGLEESRFVSVLPADGVRHALIRMQRSASTGVDRDLASEIALREQAKLVIVPSIAQYGTRLRLTVELVDPNSRRTVWTQTADANEVADALPAMDTLLRDVRSRLGESLRRIAATSLPLEKATTPSFEALRALSMAVRQHSQGDGDQAKLMLAHAIELDPDFAFAHARLGAILLSDQRYAEARAALSRALSIEGRLTERERMYVTGVLAFFSPPGATLDAWRMYSDLYPQWANGPNNIGNVHYMRLNDYVSAEQAFRKAASLYSPFRNYALQLLGHTLLAQERYAEAEAQFRAAQDLSPAGVLFGLADALAAGGRYDEAGRYLNTTVQQDASGEAERGLRRVSLLISQGRFHDAEKALPSQQRLAVPTDRWRVAFAAMALRLAADDRRGARAAVMQVLAETSDRSTIQLSLSAAEHLLYGAYWAARLGLTQQARDALALAQRDGGLDQYPVRAALAALADAQLSLSDGNAAAAQLALDQAPRTMALWEAHDLRADVAKAQGDLAREQAELHWLVAHRGLARAQWIDQFVGQQVRVLRLRQIEERLPERAR